MLQDKITINLSDSCCVDSLQRHILVRKKTLPEIIQLCGRILDEEDFIMEDEDNSLYLMINSFYRINTIIQTDYGQDGDISDNVFCTHVHENLLHND